MFEKCFLQDVRYNLWEIRLNEGGVVGYVNWMKAKFPANWGVQIAGMIFQTRSNTYLREAGNIESPTLLLLRCDEPPDDSRRKNSASQ